MSLNISRDATDTEHNISVAQSTSDAEETEQPSSVDQSKDSTTTTTTATEQTPTASAPPGIVVTSAATIDLITQASELGQKDRAELERHARRELAALRSHYRELGGSSDSEGETTPSEPDRKSMANAYMEVLDTIFRELDNTQKATAAHLASTLHPDLLKSLIKDVTQMEDGENERGAMEDPSNSARNREQRGGLP